MSLLSLQDFNELLEAHQEHLNQRITVHSETWFYGSSCERVQGKRPVFDSILGLNGEAGASDDGACLQHILDVITETMVQEIYQKKRVILIFEITDGASSFPGKTKRMVEQLNDHRIPCVAFQIGKPSPQEIKTFDTIFNGGHHYSQGIPVHDAVENLPRVLMSTLALSLTELFQ